MTRGDDDTWPAGKRIRSSVIRLPSHWRAVPVWSCSHGWPAGAWSPNISKVHGAQTVSPVRARSFGDFFPVRHNCQFAEAAVNFTPEASR